MGKILGLDLGTNSIGIAVRNEDIDGKIVDQLEYYSSVVFKSGVGKEKTGEYSFAAQRTEKRSVRRMYQSRKYRIWETLRVLMKYGYCPLTQSEWEQWACYDKSKGLKRQYPVDARRFEQWVRLDFDNDGKPEYTTPYELRAILATQPLDLSIEENRFAVGRALYHFAQRRGFKSSKGDTIKNQEENNNQDEDISIALKKSEEKASKAITNYMQENSFATVGCAMDSLIKKGVRIRNSEYTPVRQQYADEVKIICDQQNLPIEFYNEISKAIFYKRPLKSQKGSIGKCTLEKNKYRCPVSHPEFEIFRAWSLINNIKVNKEPLYLDVKRDLFNELFIGKVRDNFKFAEIIEWLSKRLSCKLSYKDKSINYKENTNVSGCPVTARLQRILGYEWQTAVIYSQAERKGKDKKKGLHQISFNYQDLWHLCFSSENVEDVLEVVNKRQLTLSEEQIKQLVKLWSVISQGYAMLSLKAIRLINVFLQKGYIYTDAVLLAKLPEILGEKLWCEYGDTIEGALGDITQENRFERKVLNIVNSLIAKYKVLDESEQFARFNYEYLLDDDDRKDVERATIDAYGENKWKELSESEKVSILGAVESYYQEFFCNKKREYFKISRLQESLSRWVMKFFAENDIHISDDKFKQLYHPSQVEFYAPAKEETYKAEDGTLISKRLLQSPVIGAFKNPMALRTLHILRQQINKLLKANIIDEDTRVVVETARTLNDANMRWAIETYQRQREEEYKEIRKRIEAEYVNRDITDADLEKVKLLLDQADFGHPDHKESREANFAKGESITFYNEWMKKRVEKYKLWLEQGCQCIYTGRIINIKNLFSDTEFDIEHTVPRSISFDDSMANLTICDSDFNRRVKKNRKPTELENYDEIKVRIQPWINRVEKLKQNIEYYKHRSRKAQTKDQKDNAIRQRHLWELELDYWEKKVNSFMMTDISTGFRNSQLVDTGIITKYAYHFLRSLFSDVSVQKGSTTAAFRKILGTQAEFEKKDRSKHSHHAIDATMLTLIPKSALRDEILKLFYEREEAKKWTEDVNLYQTIENQLNIKLKSCHIGNIDGLVSTIESNILVRHISKDQTLTPAHRRVRVRGKVVRMVNKEGQEVEKWQNGDVIRGQLHQESWLGAVRQAELMPNGKTLKRDENDKVVQLENTIYVKRKDLKYKNNDMDSGFKSWDELRKEAVNKSLIDKLEKQYEGLSFKEACEQGIYMLDKHGNKVNRIRHIRCVVSIKNPLLVKKQAYISDSTPEYKQYYYAGVGQGSLYCVCQYYNVELGKKHYEPITLFDIAENRKQGKDDIAQEIENKGKIYTLNRIIHKGVMAIVCHGFNKNDIHSMASDEISKYLYVIKDFESAGPLIKMIKHNNAQPDSELGKGESVKEGVSLPEKIRGSISKLELLIEGYDFELENGNIKLKK